MRDWLGKAWDFLMQTVGSLIVEQRWTDYKRWTDFGGSWLPKVEYKSVELNKEIKNPSYKFFWWWLRYAVLIIRGVIGRIKAFGQAIAIVGIPLQVLRLIKVLGVCNLFMQIFVRGVGNIKVQSGVCVSQYVSWRHFGTWQDWANATNGKWYYKC
jgi:hypothetical protein